MKKLILFVTILMSLLNCSAQYTKLLDFQGFAAANPRGSLFNDGTYLYGMAQHGGSYDMGTIFKMKPDGTEYTTLLDFNGMNGQYPIGALISDGIYLYGVADGGPTNQGVVFKIKPDGTEDSIIHNFNFLDGGSPMGTLYYDGSFLYGMTPVGGDSAFGNIYRIKPDGTMFTSLMTFNSSTGSGSEGKFISDGTYLYATTFSGGIENYGTIFKIKPDGTGYTKLHDNTDTASFPCSLYYDGVFLYGMTQGSSGVYNQGTIFKLKPDGTEYTTLLSFNGTNGATPNNELISDGTFLYGMTVNGGNGVGTIFKIKPDGTGDTVLYKFADTSGHNPFGALIYDGTSLYGMTSVSGSYNVRGTIFKISTDGTDFVNLHDMDATNGYWPQSYLFSDGTYLYGTTLNGGKYGAGTLFKIKPDGTGYIKMHNFSSAPDGHSPRGSLISDGTFLYGTTSGGGTNDLGAVFKIKPDGTEYSLLFSFNDTTGSLPDGTLFYDGSFLYGTTNFGGHSDLGTLFKLRPDGTEFNTIYLFMDESPTAARCPTGTLISDGTFLYGITKTIGDYNLGYVFKIKPDGTEFSTIIHFDSINGASPQASLFYDGTFLYGMTSGDYTSSVNGTIFKIRPDGTDFDNLMDFNDTISGKRPSGSLISDGIYLYGMTYQGGANNLGTVFKIKTDGAGYSKLFDFNGLNGSHPCSSLIMNENFLYGMTWDGGSGNFGTIFKMDSTSSSTGIFPIASDNMDVSVYPNPNNGIFQLTIDNEQLKSTGQLVIYNLVGEKIYSKDIRQLNNSTIIDLSDQPNGIYFMQLKTAAGKATQKIIVNK